MAMDKLPDVVHVGFSKAASTFLRAFFETHPDTFLVSDAHFFVPFERCFYDAGPEYYSALFRDARPDQLKVESDEHITLPLLHPVLRAAATTLDSVREASARVKAIRPDVKIILVVRNQVDLIVSRYGEYILGGRNCDFGDFVSEFLASREDGVNYYQNYYSRVAQIFYDDFTRERVLVILQEELLRDQSRVIGELCAFLGIEVPVEAGEARKAAIDPLGPFRVVARRGKNSRNVGLSRAGINVMRSWNNAVVREGAEAYYKRSVTRIPYALHKFAVRAIRVADYYLPRRVKGDKKAYLTDDIVRQIRDEFREDNEKLATLLSRDLAALGY